ncbi:MAG: FtsW/RodA/SpoVE family cell cycle protein [Roseburia sp.]
MLKQYKLKNYKFTLICLVAALTIIGILLIGSAQPSVQKKQLLGFVAGLVIMLIVSLIDYSFILKFSWLIYLFMIGILVAVKVAGSDSGGAQRWFEIGGFRFQPSELAKILLILFFAYYFMKYEEKINSPRVLLFSFVLAAVPLLLILKQPDLSTTIVTALIFVAILFVAGISYKLVVGVLAVSIPTFLVMMSLIIQGNFPLLQGFQSNRIMAWLYPDDYPDLAYQQQNSIMAIGSGQLWGKGLNNTDVTSVKNGNFILESQTDFIFAVAGEELGFIGTAAIILLLLFITIECILIARKAKDMAGRLICCGMAALIGFQSLINIGVASGLLPNTGLPLPFVSYGLTSLMSLYIGVGLVLNVGLQPKKY